MDSETPDNSAIPEGRFSGFARRLGLDRAVGFAVLARFWQLLTGPVTQLLIVFSFTIVEQGYYSVFLNLLAMQIFAELGLHVVLINLSSHEWAGLRLEDGRIVGDSEGRSRLISLGRTAVAWYAVAAALFVVVVSAFGFWFFEDSEAIRVAKSDLQQVTEVDWITPWFVLVLINGLQLALLPLTAILEGCGQLPVVNRVRFWQGVAGTVIVWLLVSGGFGLWALSGAAGVRLVGELWLITWRYREFFRCFRQPSDIAGISWRLEVLPLQWRMAVQGGLLWLTNHLSGLIIFRYHGPEEAARMGMMWTVLSALQAAALAWVETRRPLFGSLIAERRFGELDRQFFRFSRVSVGLIILGSSAFLCGVWVVNFWSNWFFDEIASRLPDILTVAVFAIAFITYQLALCTNIYVRAHNKDPFLVASVVYNTVSVSMIAWLGVRYGIRGVAVGYLVGVALVQVPLWIAIWYTTRRKWHVDSLDV